MPATEFGRRTGPHDPVYPPHCRPGRGRRRTTGRLVGVWGTAQYQFGIIAHGC